MQPLDRPSGSTQVLRFRGTIVQGEASGTYPKTNATFPSDAVITGSNFLAAVRFGLWDTSDLTDTQKHLPAFVFDDGQPAEDSPHDPLACTPQAGAVNATDKSLNLYTWAQNLEIVSAKIDSNVVFVDTGIAQSADLGDGALVMLDTTNSGLGRNTGLPVVCVRFLVATNQGARQSFDVDITFEVRHSAIR